MGKGGQYRAVWAGVGVGVGVAVAVRGSTGRVWLRVHAVALHSHTNIMHIIRSEPVS